MWTIVDRDGEKGAIFCWRTDVEERVCITDVIVIGITRVLVLDLIVAQNMFQKSRILLYGHFAQRWKNLRSRC